MRPNKLLFKDVSAFLALGFGTGLYPHAPGTLGTLVALPIFYLTLLLPTNISYIFAVALFFIGIYVSNHTSQILKIKDPSCIVIDEIVAFLIILLFLTQHLLILEHSRYLDYLISGNLGQFLGWIKI